MKIEGKVKAWFTNNWQTLAHIQQCVDGGKPELALSALSYTNADMTGIEGWSEAGIAHITVELLEESVLIERKAESIRREIQHTRAKAQREVEELEDRLNQLLALPNFSSPTPPGAAPTSEFVDDDIPF